MYAFVISDNRQQKIFLVRDPLGIKPLYYSQTSHQFVASSEIKAMAPFIPMTANHDVMMEYLMFGYVARPKTLFKNIFQVYPGSLIEIDRNGKTFFKKIKSEITENHKNEKLGDVLHKTIQSYTASDAGMALLLSGGVDSSYLAAVMPKPLNTFSIALADQKFDERQYQQSIAQKFSTNHQSFEFGPEDLYQLVSDCTWAMDAPVFHLGSILLHALYKQIAKSSKVAITGEGADELFGGYERYRLTDEQIKNRLKKFNLHESTSDQQLLPQLEALYPFLRRLYLSPARLQTLCPDVSFVPEHQSDRLQLFINRQIDIELIYQHDQQFHLEALLTRQDRMSSLASVECRVPFCDSELWSRYAAIPLAQKIGEHGPKTMLKKELLKYLPTEMVNRRKKGLGMPVQEWLLKSPMQDLLSLLQTQKARERGFYHGPAIDYEIQRLRANDYASSQYLMRLILLELWCLKFF
jgi:asparagine synthase (glutamine-hydrolysing)